MKLTERRLMKKRDSIKKNFRSVATAFGLLSSLSFAYPVIAQNAVSSTYSGRIGFAPPPDDAAPNQTRGGATRGRCQATSLMPRSGSGLTMSDRASIFVYVSKHPEAKLNKAILTLKEDANASEQYDAVIDLPEEALSQPGGVLEVKFPESMPALEVGKNYSWSLIMICDDLPIRPDSPVVGGGIKRVAPSSEIALSEELSATEQAIAYGEAGLWYDLLATLASEQSEAPEYAQLNEAWRKILTEAGISEEISESAFIN